MRVKETRGSVFGTVGPSQNQTMARTGVNPYRAMANMPSQFGRSLNAGMSMPNLGGRFGINARKR